MVDNVPIRTSSEEAMTKTSLRVAINEHVVEIFIGATPFSFLYAPLKGDTGIEVGAVGGEASFLFDCKANAILPALRIQ